MRGLKVLWLPGLVLAGLLFTTGMPPLAGAARGVTAEAYAQAVGTVSPVPTNVTATPTATPPPAQTKVKVWLVDFRGQPADPPGNYQVIRDREGQNPQRINEFEEDCPTKKDSVEWKDCKPDWPDGKPEKNWPVAYVRDPEVVIKQARFKVSSDQPLRNVTVKGTASVGKASTLEWQQGGVNQVGNELVINNVASAGKLPNFVTVFDPMTIKWEVKNGAETLDAGSSGHTVYVLFKPPLRPVYLTLADNTTHYADGKDAEATVFAGIWSEFQTLLVQRRDLDPVSGRIENGATLSYYDPANKGFTTCSHTNTLALLKFTLVGCPVRIDRNGGFR